MKIIKKPLFTLISDKPASEWDKGIKMADIIENMKGSAEDLKETANRLERSIKKK